MHLYSALEQQALTAAGTTGVGAPTVTSGIGQLLAAQTPNINQFFNPYQSFVVDEINRQAAQAQNRLAAQAVDCRSFWWRKRRCCTSRIREELD